MDLKTALRLTAERKRFCEKLGSDTDEIDDVMMMKREMEYLDIVESALEKMLKDHLDSILEPDGSEICTVEEMKRYLDNFDDEAEIGIYIADVKRRKLAVVEDFFGLLDSEVIPDSPSLCIEINGFEDMEAEMIRAIEEDEEEGEI